MAYEEGGDLGKKFKKKISNSNWSVNKFKTIRKNL